MKSIKPYLKLLRPKQWVKNAFIFIPLVFDGQLADRAALAKTTLGFVLLCAVYGAIYIFNDLNDLEADKAHPKKRSRPLASGAVTRRAAILIALFCLAVGLGGGAWIGWRFLRVLLAIITINIIYTKYFKKEVILDVILIGVLFLLRVFAGLALVTVKIFSPWLFLMTFMLALFLGFGKRRAEMVRPDIEKDLVRPTLSKYSIELLDRWITIVSSVTIMAYSLYTFSGPTLPRNNLMMFTIPVVVYGVFRYHYLIYHENEGDAPEEILIKDAPFRFTVLIYAAIVVYALYIHG